MPRERTWKVIERGKVPELARSVEFTCTGCWTEAKLPVLGHPMAQVEMGIVFDHTEVWAMPAAIQCRKCRRIYEYGDDE